MGAYAALVLAANRAVRPITADDMLLLCDDVGLLAPSRRDAAFGNLAPDITELFRDTSALAANDRFFCPDSISWGTDIEILSLEDDYVGSGFRVSIHGNGYFFPWGAGELRERVLSHPKLVRLRRELQARFGGRFGMPWWSKTLRRRLIDGDGGWAWFMSESLEKGRCSEPGVARGRTGMEEVGGEAAPGRRRFVLEAALPDDIPATLPLAGPSFVGLLAWDARQVSAAEVGAVAGRLLAAGCVYAVCWGPDCERVHDAFDEADLARRPSGPWAMTTWHADEALSEAIWFALFAARPDDTFAEGCRSVVGISVGSRAWATELREAFASPDGFRARVLGDG